MPVNSDPTLRPPLDNDRLLTLLSGTPDLAVEIVAEAASTNALLAQRARDGGAEGSVVVAEHQTAGRGRLDRRWETPAASGLTFSLLLRPTVSPSAWPWLPLLAGYAVDRALQTAGYASGVKWPNDVLIEGRKVAGILVERIDTAQGPAAVVGVGLNVHLTPEELPVETATALSLESCSRGGPPDRTDVLAAVLTQILRTYADWQAGGETGAAGFASAYAQACVTVGQDVRVDLPDGSALTGRATAVDPTGALVVRSPGPGTGPSGETEHRVGAGDVVHVRPRRTDQ